MRCIYQDNIPLAEMTLRIITGINDLVLTKGKTQKDFKRLLGARSICLDYHGVDTEGRQYDLEVQKADSGARPERARYHSAAMDIEALNTNQLFEELPETYTIFVTENDIYGFGDGIYPIERVIVTHEQLFNDRAHILYVNGAYRGNDSWAEFGKIFPKRNEEKGFSITSCTSAGSFSLIHRSVFIPDNLSGMKLLSRRSRLRSRLQM